MLTCYTAIFSNYENLKEPTVITPNVQYLAFTDQPLKSKVWAIVKTDCVDPVLKAREVKISWLPEGKSLWVDGSITINCDLNEFWNKHFISPFTVIKHPMRNCWFKEALACITNQRAGEAEIRKQRDIYLAAGLPFNSGLIQSGILMRENTEEVLEFCSLWHDQIKLSTRDQIGFAYTEFKLNKKWPRIEYDYRTGKQFQFKTHYHRRQ